jgi:hypothetical protein
LTLSTGTGNTAGTNLRKEWTRVQLGVLEQTLEAEIVYTYAGNYQSLNGIFPIRMDEPARTLPVLQKLQNVLDTIPDADAPRGRGGNWGTGFGNTSYRGEVVAGQY